MSSGFEVDDCTSWDGARVEDGGEDSWGISTSVWRPSESEADSESVESSGCWVGGGEAGREQAAGMGSLRWAERTSWYQRRQERFSSLRPSLMLALTLVKTDDEEGGQESGGIAGLGRGELTGPKGAQVVWSDVADAARGDVEEVVEH